MTEKKVVIVFRHMPYVSDPEDKSFWQIKAGLDLPSNYGRTLIEIKRFLYENNCAVREIHSTTILRARETAIGLADSIEVSSEKPRVIFSKELDPQIDEWEKLNWSKEEYHSVMSVEAMYKKDSPSKPLLQREGEKFLEYIKNMLKKMENDEAIIIVSHSPLIEALESTLKKDWRTIPKTIDRGTSIGLVFDNENKLISTKNLPLRFTGP